jgi:hypothetical protein
MVSAKTQRREELKDLLTKYADDKEMCDKYKMELLPPSPIMIDLTSAF